MNIEQFIEKISHKDKKAIARALTEIENNTKIAQQIIDKISSKYGHSYRVGITGPPGAGKSTLTNALVKLLVSKNFSVGVIAVDPTSPFTGGALLGDRIRMSEIGTHPNVFIRSMASRGSLGGLNQFASEAGDVFDFAGFDFTIYETVGVGQSELDVANNVDTTVVVLVPESGDSIQAMKAGLMEIGDIFVMNKSDRAGADQAVASLQFILSFKEHDENTWLPPIIKTTASENKGIEELYLKILEHKEFLEKTGQLKLKREQRFKNRIKDLISNYLKKELWNDERVKILDKKLQLIFENREKVSNVVRELVDNFKNGQ
ncbi:MAG: methylmalonyl Co-A mutase-associated GTPase MeaB [Ignavibacteria bacterium]|jgi:LAO/AO transport system kinase|nr:methylmalonyl Co-A mutase-associated GTPase MeaB [Ignavibacteria bacterium]MDH7527546.1 methylmalonyl Co-A mutase-associated GTPase MeaB [Ignavibacteria bacterium]